MVLLFSTGRKSSWVWLVAAVMAVVLLTLSCSDSTEAEDVQKGDEEPKPKVVANGPARDIYDLTERYRDELNFDDLPRRVEGFRQEEIEAYAQRLVTVMERGISPGVNDMAADRAVEYVTRDKQYPGLSSSLIKRLRKIGARYDWEWVLASRFRDPIRQPAHVLKAAWKVTSDARYAGEVVTPYLSVKLSIVVRHDVVVDETIRPIVVTRSLTLMGFEPLGPTKWQWNGWQLGADAFGDDGCALANDARLKPGKDAKELKAEFRYLKRLLARKGTVPGGKSTKTDDLRRQVKAFGCDRKPRPNT